MAVTITIGSGKGGVGKTMVLCNLALLLAKKGKKVCLVDLDIGGADAHLLFGLFSPKHSLTDFLTRKIPSISDALHTLYSFDGLQIIPGTDSTLQTANMTYQEKHRLLKSLSGLDADVVLIDVGAGTSFHSLDFFMYGDVQICITMPEPTSIMDFYNFLQLATIRKVLDSFLSHGQVSMTLKKQNFSSLSEVFAMAGSIEGGAKEKAQQALHSFNPLLIVNRYVENGKINKTKLKQLVAKYLGIDIPTLGEIPEDGAVSKSLRAYMPVCEIYPEAPSAKALSTIADKIEKVVELFERQQHTADTIEKE